MTSQGNVETLLEASRTNALDGYCTLCITIRTLAQNIRFKFTIMVVTLMCFQLALEGVYWRQEKDFILGRESIPSGVNIGVVYSLFAFEGVILSSIILAR